MGLCDTPPAGHKHSLLGLSNSTCFRENLAAIHGRFQKLYRRKAHLHHYTQFIEEEDVEAASGTIVDLIDEYTALENTPPPEPGEGPGRFVPAGD